MMPTDPAGSEPNAETGGQPDAAVATGARPIDDEAPQGPRAVVDRDGVTFTLLGTAHVSIASAREVEREVASGAYDAVAIELDRGRYEAIVDPDRWARLDLFQVLRQGKMGTLALSLALGAFQQRLADQLGIEPGQEMRAAIAGAKEASLPLLLIDRDLGVTLRRVRANLPWWQRLTLMAGVAASVLARERVDEQEIEKLKQGDVLEATFAEFAENEAALFEPLIAERDRYMAGQLERQVLGAAPESRPSRVLVVLGAGHLAGTARALAPADDGAVAPADELEELERTPPPSVVVRLLPWLVVALVLIGFFLGFQRNPDLGWRLLLEWVVINGGLAGLGTIVALAHPVTVVGTALAAPFTSLNPMVGAGFVAAGLELWLRKPTVGDFQRLRRDVTTVAGWWRNRAARVFVVFLLATLGSASGTYLAGFRIIDGLLR